MVLRSEKGFTLIEMICILVILGIVSSIAIPKYIDLTQEAKNRAALMAVADGKSRLSRQYAKLFLEVGTPPTVTDIMAVVTTNAGDDYQLNFASTGPASIRISAAGRGPNRGTSSGTWYLP